MCTYVHELFGIEVHHNEAGEGIFQQFKGAKTILVQSVKESKSGLDDEASSKTSNLNLSLILKKENQRKVNSHMWWLGAHAPDLNSEYVFATDCGIVFEPQTMAKLAARLDADKRVAAVTGFQRVMPSHMQGDGNYELFSDPVGHFLRQVQRYDFEVSGAVLLLLQTLSWFSSFALIFYFVDSNPQLDQSITKSAFDSVGFMPVLPGPCGLYRFNEWGNLKQGIMHEYFSLVHKPVDNIVFGNVQLAEDRIPSCLLVFRHDEQAKPRTGFVHDAIFYFEAEKPLGQLVKQRRRWLNGTYAAYLWVHREGWVWRGGHHFLTKLFAAVFVLLNLVQGAFVRLCGPAVTAIGIYALCQILPEVISGDPTEILQAMLDDSGVDRAMNRPMVTAGSLTASMLYILAYAVFVIGHTPRAVPVHKHRPDCNWRQDKRSAYRPRLFALGFAVNLLAVMFFLAMSMMVTLKVDWNDIPRIVKALVCLPLIPYALVLMDCIVNNPYPDLTSFWNLVKATPHYLMSSLWFSIWLPAYATARISDLSWGNRDTIDGQDGDSAVAQHRARIGQRTTIVLVCSNTVTTLVAIAAIYTVPGFVKGLLIATMAFTSVLYVMSLGDMTMRLVCRVSSTICGAKIMTKEGSDKGLSDPALTSVRTTHTYPFPSSNDLSLPLGEDF